MEQQSTIFVAGHKGLVGSAVVSQLQARGFNNLIVRSHSELDLVNQQEVISFFRQEQPEYVVMCAGKVGGIWANQSQQSEFLYDNIAIAINVIKSAFEVGVKKLLYLGSSCIYPKMSPQPILESYLLSGPLEETNEGYALAKICGLKLCEYLHRQHGAHFISAMPTNLYGPGDNFHPSNSHVIPGMMRRFHEARITGKREVLLWGDGSSRREFLYVSDLAEAIYILMDQYEDSTPINIGCGEDISIRELAELMRTVVGFEGKVIFDTSMPSGTPRKLLDISKVRSLGWSPKIGLRDGLQQTYAWAIREGILEMPQACH